METRTGRQMGQRTKKMVTLAMLAAMTYVVMWVSKMVGIPLMGTFLTYDPKDIVIAIAGFLYGPLSVVAISVVVSFLEMITVSATGPLGFLMNVLSTVAFAGTAALIYKKKQTLGGAVVGLLCGIVATVAVMMPWNYFVTPYHMGLAREAVAAMLLPMFLPFNLLKTSINAAVILLLYKPLVTVLRKANLAPPSKAGQQQDAVKRPKKGFTMGVTVVSLLVIATCVMFVLVNQGVI